MSEPSRGGADTAGPGSAQSSDLRSAIAARIGEAAARFARESRGATAIEYAMIGGLIFCVAAGSIRLYGSKVTVVYGQITNAVNQAN